SPLLRPEPRFERLAQHVLGVLALASRPDFRLDPELLREHHRRSLHRSLVFHGVSIWYDYQECKGYDVRRSMVRANFAAEIPQPPVGNRTTGSAALFL